MRDAFMAGSDLATGRFFAFQTGRPTRATVYVQVLNIALAGLPAC